MTIGMIASVLPVNKNLKNHVNQVIKQMEQKKSSKHFPQIPKFRSDRPQYAFQLPHFKKVYDLITFNKILLEGLAELHKKEVVKSKHQHVSKIKQILRKSGQNFEKFLGIF